MSLRNLRDNVIGSKNVAAFGVDDHARARCLDLLFKLLGKIKKLPKDGISVERIVFLDPRVNRDIDDREGGLLYNGRKGWNLAAPDIWHLREDGGPRNRREKEQRCCEPSSHCYR